MYSLRLYAAASSCADVGKKEEKNFFALSTYFHGRTQLHHSGLDKILKLWRNGLNTIFLGFLTNFHGIVPICMKKKFSK